MTITIDPTTVQVTSPDDFELAFDAFVRMMLAIARVRAGGSAIFDQWADRLLEPTLALVRGGEVEQIVREMSENAADRLLLAQLTEELWFYVWAYRAADESLAQQVPHPLRTVLAPTSRDPGSDDPVDDAETIVKSIDAFLEKLPARLRKFLHAIMEVLKLTRGLS